MSRKRIDPKLPIPDLQNGSPAEKELYAPNAFGDRLLRRENELFREFDDTVSIYDEGTYLGEADGLNFVGTDVAATANTSLLGVYDITVTGSGSGTDTITATASEAIAAGQFVAVYDASGTPKCRVAKSSSGQGFQADGFCKDAFASGATATIFLPGTVNVAGGTGLTAGDVWLGTDGYATDTAPTTTGYISQQIGVAENSTHVAFEPQPDILIAATHDVTTGCTSQSVVITSSQSITISSAIGAAWLTMIGGGGGGGSTTASSSHGVGGGGAGEYCQNLMIPLTPGETATVTIGAGGTAGSDGGTTSFACAAGTYSVLGGKGSTGNSGGNGGGPRGGTGGAASTPGALGSAESPCHFGGSSGGGGGVASSTAGGAGGGGPGNLNGGTGSSSNTHGGGGGGGGASPWGVGGAGGAGNGGGSNAPAGAYGAGGGGAGGNDGTGQTGGSGAAGYVMLMYVS